MEASIKRILARRAVATRALAQSPAASVTLRAGALLAIAAPVLVAYTIPPSRTFLNEVVALAGWSVFLAVLGRKLGSGALPGTGSAWSVVAALAIVLLSAIVAPLWTGAPWSLALTAGSTLAAAILVFLAGAATARGGFEHPAYSAVCGALVVAAALNGLVGLTQVFEPSLTDGVLIAPTVLAGRATGNIRQPNNLSTLILWAVIAVVWLRTSGRLRLLPAGVLLACFGAVLFLTGSRMGWLVLAGFAGWAFLSRSLGRASRLLLVVPLVALVAAWGIQAAGVAAGYEHFGGGTRGAIADGNLSSSRIGIWSDALALLARYPWTGIGFGEFNFAWTLSAFPGRSGAFFDHTHNLLLNLLVELGVPLGTMTIAALAYAFAGSLRNAIGSKQQGEFEAAELPVRRAAFAMLCVVLVHSMLEYPLWYPYLLLPSVFLFGLCAEERDPGLAGHRSGSSWARRVWLVAPLLLALGTLLTVFDFSKVAAIASEEETTPLEQRIARAQRSVLFSHRADYFAATTGDDPSERLKAFERASHYLLDARLMIAGAKAMSELGDEQRARFIAARLREFRSPQAARFLAPCQQVATGAGLPFQCLQPTATIGLKAFR
ncbi:PglL family O-oligosaccharyltransferase [Piscinibacter koreensis]|uniref:O-antigen ligase C-terminal domain-containing protein n=1 Tax=Piscinibacter koreensis TaxID=2742824 RepID=A0A7Y6NJR7_9BURK|nr:O-antigen ligase family protein [Schlegelella koreensis]NUZ04455.1 O-antigen ligase C-terminal domain-containing protein [Schlegelella koreensis]